MGVERLERVLWRLRKRHPGQSMVTWRELERAIMYECGTDPLTIKNNKLALKKLGWIKITRSGGNIVLTGEDLDGS